MPRVGNWCVGAAATCLLPEVHVFFPGDQPEAVGDATEAWFGRECGATLPHEPLQLPPPADVGLEASRYEWKQDFCALLNLTHSLHEGIPTGLYRKLHWWDSLANRELAFAQFFPRPSGLTAPQGDRGAAAEPLRPGRRHFLTPDSDTSASVAFYEMCCRQLLRLKLRVTLVSSSSLCQVRGLFSRNQAWWLWPWLLALMFKHFLKVNFSCVSYAMCQRTSSRPGPKSGARHTYVFLLVIFSTLVVSSGVRVGGQGTSPPPGGAGAPGLSVNKAVPKPRGRNVPDLLASPPTFKTAKRAFQRALRRAQLHGTTMYRGRCRTLQELGGRPGAVFTSKGLPGSSTAAPSRSPYAKHGPRLTVLTLNVGGLSQDAWDEVQIWIHDQCTQDIILLQETHWSHSNMFFLPRYIVIHSGTAGHRHQGCAILLSKQRFTPSGVRWAPIVPGHLLHARASLGTKPVDVVCLYQHCWSHNGDTASLLQRRERLWVQLDKLLGGVPRRNVLVLGGDFNVGGRMDGQVFGPGTKSARAPPPDQPLFQSLLQTHSLQAINTWKSGLRAFTFQNGETFTQIDFLIGRARQVDDMARGAESDHNCPVLKWRYGPLHHPVYGSFPACWYATAPATPSVPKQAKLSLAQTPEAIRAFREKLALALPNAETPQELNDCLQEAATPLMVEEPRPPLSHLPQVRGLVGAMWEARRRALEVSWSTGLSVLPLSLSNIWDVVVRLHFTARVRIQLRSVWQGWCSAARYLALHRALRKTSRKARRQVMDDRISAAAQAEQQGDRSALFAVVRTFMPKQPRMRTQLRGPEGELLSSAAEADAYEAYCRTVYAPALSAREELPPLAPPAENTAPPVSLTLEHVLQALRSFSARKAVPRHLAPILLWKLGADLVGPHLHRLYLQARPPAAVFPPLWADSWLTWLPKQGKTGTTPAEQRPISLTDCGGKAVTKAFTSQLQPTLREALAPWPQFAYLGGRCIEHAVARVTAHCVAVRDRLASGRVTLKQRRAGSGPQGQCYGGVMVSVDCSKAFDTVDRQVLKSELCSAGVHPEDVDFIMRMHTAISYHPVPKDPRRAVHSKRGVRQGCALAPSLWSLITVALLRALAEKCGTQWVTDLVTMYADDLLETWEVYTRKDLDLLMQAVSQSFQLLEALGLQVQPQKTKVVLALRGRQARLWIRRHTLDTPDGRVLLIPAPNGKPHHLPIVSSIKYLGVVLSYGDFEGATLTHRLSCAEANRSRILRILHSRSVSLRRRVQLWRACVFSSAVYGLHVVGLRPKHLRRLTVALVRHLRAIAGSFAHIHHEASRALLDRLGVADPLEAIRQRNQTLVESSWSTKDPQVSHPRVLGRLRVVNEALTRLSSSLRAQTEAVQGELVDQVLPSPPQSREGAPWGQLVHSSGGLKEALFHCWHCDLCFAELAALKRHLQDAHDAHTLPVSSETGFREHSVGGMPVCAHCQADLVSWNNFKRHHRYRHCPVLWLRTQQSQDVSPPQDDPPPVPPVPMESSTLSAPQAWIPLADWPQLRDAPMSQWLEIFRIPSAAQILREGCAQCGQWLVSVKSIKLHYKHVHPDIYAAWAKPAAADCRRFGRVLSPCPHCHQSITRTDIHCSTCPALWQARLVSYVRGRTHRPGNGGGVRQAAPCREAGAGTSPQISDAVGNGPPIQGEGHRKGQLKQRRLSFAPQRGERSPRQGGDDAPDGATAAATHGLPSPPALGPHGHHHIPQRRHPGMPPARPPREGRDLAPAEAREVAQPHSDTSANAPSLHASGTPGESYDAGDLCSTGAGRSHPLHGTALDDGRGSLEPLGLRPERGDHGVVDPQKRPRPRAEVLKELERLIIIFKTPELILKYDSFRPLKGKLEGPLMTFQLELSLQSPVAHEAMQILRGWFGLSHMLLMGARIKPERAIRPHLAQALQQALFG